MNLAALALVSSLVLAGGSAPRADGPLPGGLTAWRTAQGIFLSWSASPSGSVEIWRGTESGKLSLVATLPGGQHGFLDLSAARRQEYFYALGSGKRPGAELNVPGGGGPVQVLAGLVTTCSGLAPNSMFPANTQNFFVRSRDNHVQYYGYFLVRPYVQSPHDIRLVWRDPHGAVFSEFSRTINPKRVEISGEAMGQILMSMPVGLREAVAENGQKSVPTEPGMYTVEAFVDDEPVALSVFYIREEQSQQRPAGQ